MVLAPALTVWSVHHCTGAVSTLGPITHLRVCFCPRRPAGAGAGGSVASTWRAWVSVEKVAGREATRATAPGPRSRARSGQRLWSLEHRGNRSRPSWPAVLLVQRPLLHPGFYSLQRRKPGAGARRVPPLGFPARPLGHVSGHGLGAEHRFCGYLNLSDPDSVQGRSSGQRTGFPLSRIQSSILHE